MVRNEEHSLDGRRWLTHDEQVNLQHVDTMVGPGHQQKRHRMTVGIFSAKDYIHSHAENGRCPTVWISPRFMSVISNLSDTVILHLLLPQILTIFHENKSVVITSICRIQCSH